MQAAAVAMQAAMVSTRAPVAQRRLGSAPRRCSRVAYRQRPRAAVYHLAVEAAHDAHAHAQGAKNVAVTFTLHRKVNFGQQLVLVGSAEQLGSWQLENAPHMTWTDGDVWTAVLELPAGSNVEYKFALTDPNGPAQWETCANRVFSVPTATVVTCAWDEPGATTCEPADSDHVDDLSPPPAFRPAQVLASYESAVGGGGDGRGHTAVAHQNGQGNYSPEQLDFLKRKLETIQASPSATKQSAAPVANGNGKVHYTPEQLEFLRRSGKLSGSSAAPAAAPARARSTSPRPSSRPASSAPAPAASGAQYTPEQLEFLRRSGKSPSPSPSPRPSSSPCAASPRPTSRPPSSSAAPAASGAQYTSEQLEFLRRSGKSPSPLPAPRSTSPRPSSRPSSSAAPAAAPIQHYSPEQLEFLRRSGKAPGSTPSPRPAAAQRGSSAAAPGNYTPEQLEFLRRTGKL